MHDPGAPLRPERAPLDVEKLSMLRALLLCELIGQIEISASSTSSARPTGASRRDLAPALRKIMEIRSALDRLDDGSYGICEACRRLVPFTELESEPARRTCSGCLPAPTAVRGLANADKAHEARAPHRRDRLTTFDSVSSSTTAGHTVFDNRRRGGAHRDPQRPCTPHRCRNGDRRRPRRRARGDHRALGSCHPAAASTRHAHRDRTGEGHPDGPRGNSRRGVRGAGADFPTHQPQGPGDRRRDGRRPPARTRAAQPGEEVSHVDGLHPGPAAAGAANSLARMRNTTRRSASATAANRESAGLRWPRSGHR